MIDVIEILTGSSIPKRYWSDLKKKLTKEGIQLYENIVQLKFEAADGKKYQTDCADTQTLLRLIQSIPSPKAEPFKQWLAKVGYERMQEIQDPAMSLDRAIKIEQLNDFSPQTKNAGDKLRHFNINDLLTNLPLHQQPQHLLFLTIVKGDKVNTGVVYFR